MCFSMKSSAQLTTPNLSPSLLVSDPMSFWCPAAAATSRRRDGPASAASAAGPAAGSKTKGNKSGQLGQRCFGALTRRPQARTAGGEGDGGGRTPQGRAGQPGAGGTRGSGGRRGRSRHHRRMGPKDLAGGRRLRCSTTLVRCAGGCHSGVSLSLRR
jgi:hypothetical protein